MKPYLFLIRGLPGSGKSTLATWLAAMCSTSTPITHLWVEADQFFTAPDGTYIFEGHRLGDAHAWCQAKVADVMLDGENPVIVSNTFTRQWEMDAYKKMALQYGYEVVEMTCGAMLSIEELEERGTHGVPLDTLRKMQERWEP